ncbi:MAG: PhoH family protein [Acidimicrobiales bacterium]
MQRTPIKITVPGNHLMPSLLGERDSNIRIIEDAWPTTQVLVRGNEIIIEGPEAETVSDLVHEMVLLVEHGHPMTENTLRQSIDMVRSDESPADVLTSEVFRSPRGVIKAKSAGQKLYVEAMRKNIITFGIGPAGTGKSWLAVALAVQALMNKEVDRIILTRPAVEAGERLGFLPGDLMAKVDPYLRPLYDALHDMVDGEGVERMLEKGAVEVAPLAFMRGRTLNNAFIILDEAQNTSPEQMKMFLTRIGFGSKVVVTGDITQTDIRDGKSGLIDLEKILGNVDGIEFIRLSSRDVVRHRIVQDIVNAYENRSK